MIHIYALIDPRTDTLRYVGMTSRSPIIRFKEHIDRRKSSHTGNWIRSVLDDGYVPEMEIIEIVTDDNWQSAERFWISYFRYIGCNLTNQTDGGELGGPQIVSDETRRKRSERMKGHRMSQESIEKMRASKTGKHLPEGQSARISALHKGRKRSQETKDRISRAHKGKVVKEETKKKLSEITKRNWEDPSFVEKVTAGRMRHISEKNKNEQIQQ